MSVEEDQRGPKDRVSEKTRSPGTTIPALRNRKETETRKESALRRALSHPVRSVPLAFLCVIVIGAGLLMLPLSRTGNEP